MYAAPNWDYRASKMTMQIVVTVSLLSSCLLVVLSSGYDPNSKHWAFGMLGTLVGFWLRGSR
jgi:hypothetical protein